jgi:RNA polymerase-interacting CarD/CdnL/TRCF family regulator
MKDKIARGALLYHATHGLCCVRGVLKKNLSNENVLCCELVPEGTNLMNIRYVIPVEHIAASGFHPPITSQEARMILEYLKTDNRSAVIPHSAHQNFSHFDQQSPTWTLAKEILSSSYDKKGARDQRKRQTLKSSVMGLVRELALVLKISIAETVAKIQVSLGRASDINPVLLAALRDADED